MSETKTCGRCGAELSDETAGGLCPRCLMAVNFESRTMPAGEAPPKVAPLAPEEMRERFPQFEILECLGRGGMGVVYKARQKALDRVVAIKVLAGEWQGDPGFARRFEKEAKTLAQMSHPNIVTIHDFGEASGLFYLVMEHVDGVNLRDLLREGKMAPEQALAIVPPVCEALEYAHGKGVVHRDIKPENLLLDREGRVKIADFGIASLVGAGGERSGTPPYMAPEQETGGVDKRADIYALGVVLYEMLTGERPARDVVAPSRKVELDVRIDEMVLRALEKEPERRYQTAGEFRTVAETVASAPMSGEEASSGGAEVRQAELDAMSADPSNWRFLSLIYVCRRDPRIVVPRRVNGFGWTVNLAQPWALPFAVAVVAVVLGATNLATRYADLSTAQILSGVLMLVAGLAWICHRMSRGPVSRGAHPPVIARTLITVGIAFGLVGVLWEWPASGTPAARLRAEGWKLWQTGRLAEARETFEEAVKLRPDDADAWNGLGWARFNSGDAEGGRAAFEKVLELEPRHPGALNGIGQIALSKREDDTAERYLLEAAERNATAAWFGLARLYLLQGRFEEAEKWAAKLESSGDRGEISTRMLEAALARKVPDDLRTFLNPPLQAESEEGSTSPAPPPESDEEMVTRRAVFEIEIPADGVEGNLDALFREYFDSGNVERDLFRESGRAPVDLEMAVDPLPAPGRFAIMLTCRGKEVADDLIASFEAVLDGWGEERGISFRRIGENPVETPEIEALIARFVAANARKENALAFKEAIATVVESAEPLLGRPVEIEAVVESVTGRAVQVRFFPTAVPDSDSVPQLRFVGDPGVEVTFWLSASGMKFGGTRMGGSGKGELAIGPMVDERLARDLIAGDVLRIDGRLERVQEAHAWDGYTEGIPKRPKSKAVAGLVISEAKVGLLQAADRPAGGTSKRTGFEVRRVSEVPSPDAEELAWARQAVEGGEATKEKLRVEKQALLDQSALQSAEVRKNPETGAAEIHLMFTEAGGRRFAEATRQNTGRRLAILIDGRILSAPTVISEIPDGRAVISGSFSEQEADRLARRLNEGIPD